MEKRIIELYRRKFDDIRHEEDGIEYWYARELMTLLDYVQWRNFENVVKKGMLSCKNNGIRVEDHFAGVSKMVILGSGANREVEDYMLTRYACYLIAENGDPRKEQIAFAQSYFAVQTRKQELIEERISYIERTEARGKLRESEKRLSQNIYERGVDDAGVNGRAAQPDDDKARHRANADGQRCKHNSEERKPRARTYHAVVAQLIGNKARYEAPRRYADEK